MSEAPNEFASQTPDQECEQVKDSTKESLDCLCREVEETRKLQEILEKIEAKREQVQGQIAELELDEQITIFIEEIFENFSSIIKEELRCPGTFTSTSPLEEIPFAEYTWQTLLIDITFLL